MVIHWMSLGDGIYDLSVGPCFSLSNVIHLSKSMKSSKCWTLRRWRISYAELLNPLILLVLATIHQYNVDTWKITCLGK